MQKGSALIPLSLFFTVIILAVFSGWYYANNRTPNPPSNSTPTQPVITSENKEPSPEIYENPESRFKFKFPKGYKVIEETEEEYFKRANGDTRKNFTYYVQYPPAEFLGSAYVLKTDESDLDNAVLSVLAFKNPDNLTALDFYNRYWYYPFVWGEFSSSEKAKVAPKSVEIISGKEASSAVVHYRDADPKFIYLPIPGEGLIYQLRLPTENNEDGETILKSLIFE